MKFNYTLLFVASFAFIGCDGVKETAEELGNDVNESLTGQTIDLDYMDDSTRPQDDFFQFANGTWIKNNPVPASESRWGSFNELDKANKEKLTAILEEAQSKNGSKGSTDQILGDYYSSFINMNLRNEMGTTPIEESLVEIDGINSKDNFGKIILRLHKEGIRSTFSFSVGQDLKDVDQHIAYIGQGGIGLPNKEYYFKDDKADILKRYQKHISNMLNAVLGVTSENADKQAEAIVSLETQLAKNMMAPAELRIPEKTYNKYSRKTAIRLFETFDFDAYLGGTGINSFDSCVVSQPDFVSNVSKLIEDVDIQTWKSYFKWNLINHYAGHLDSRLVEMNFNFYGTTLRGKKEMKPLNERAIDEITGMEFAELLGKAFVEKHFSEEAKNKVNTMVDNLLIVFEERLSNLDWMSEETKKEALHKLKSIGRKLGFPDKWEDFSSLDFKKDDYIHNIRQTAEFAYKKNIAKLGKNVDKDEWGMPAHMVNAYYHPLLNEIAFPAGIMQPPFFSENYEDAVNYGRIGMVIGHEFTHGFDDMGSKFAADGSFNNWWSDNDRSLFESRTKILGNTFAGFCPIDGHCVNPDLTMGENIADLGGLTMAYHAYERTAEFKSGLKKKGYTPAQRFFIAYAQLWKINYTDEELKNRIANDPHSPGMYRVNGPLMNCPEFFDAFNVQESDPMRNPEGSVSRIW